MAMSVGPSSGRGRIMAEINITPFTDVCLVLLIIFMVSASFLSQPKGMDVKLPDASRKATTLLPSQDLTITLGKNGSMFVESNPVTFDGLFAELKKYTAANAKAPNVVIKADQDIPYDQVVRVMGAVRESGLSYMSLAVENPNERRPGQ